ncbi:MAG: shikimate dehydrogenase [Ruminococcaceae bacterium]|nr:shikimate dehydrogenase [Oscillospiraceae bacterium]
MKTNLAVIGDPIAHSLSPVIHTTVMEDLGIDYGYEKIRIPKGELPHFLKSEQCRLMKGFNLTMPHKQDVMTYLDHIDRDAVIFDAVNTVKVEDNRLLGYNTDGAGCLRAMMEKGYDAKGKCIVIFGAGGVVSTVALKMALEEAESIVILNRTLKSAEVLAKNVFSRTGKRIITGELEPETMTKYCESCDILINGTPLGMEGIDRDFEDFTFLEALQKDSLVYDLIYKPEMTSLLKNAKGLGLETLNGLGMLIYQGLLADEIFLDTSLDFPCLKAKIEERIKKM